MSAKVLDKRINEFKFRFCNLIWFQLISKLMCMWMIT